jgi:hypothetical protein
MYMKKSNVFMKVSVILIALILVGGVVTAADVTITGTISGGASLDIGAATIALGTLVDGVESTGSVSITENTNNPSGYTVTVQSLEGFNLRLTGSAAGAPGSLIPYTISYGVSGSEAPVTASGTSPVTLTDSTSKPQNNSIAKNFIVAVTADGSEAAGTFSDELTFAISNK